MPAPVAKAASAQEPTPAARPATYEQSAGQSVLNATEVIVESPPTVSPAPAHEPARIEGPVFRLDANSDPSATYQPPTQMPAPPLQPVPAPSAVTGPEPAPGSITTYANPPSPVITEHATTARAYYVAPAIQVFIPRSTATIRRPYYAGEAGYPIEVPAQRVTVLRPPGIRISLGGPMPADLFVPAPTPPSEFGVVVAPEAIPVVPPPMIPGQPVRNALRAMMW